MSDIQFQFTKIDRPEVLTFDPSLERFFDMDIESTIKEDLQNSLDARLPNSYLPSKVTLTLDKISVKDLPGIDEIKKRISSLTGGNLYTKDKITYMNKHINEDYVYVLTIEDENTKGLTGAKNGDRYQKNDTFGIYAYNKGIHFEEEDINKEKSRGGSHGIGKIANNAASDIHLMYFANCDENGEQHLAGTIQLIDHRLDELSYRAIGYYSLKENSILYPYPNYSANGHFRKDTRGLKIIIPYLREDFADFKKLVTAVCDNFFVAILQNKIEVEINDNIQRKTLNISTDSIFDIVNDTSFYETDPGEIKEHFTPLYVHTYQNMPANKITIADKRTTYEFDLHFNFDPQIRTGRLGVVRSLGMKIEDLKIRNNVRQPFNAILIGGSKEDVFLKTLENESHTKLSDSEIKDKEEKSNAKKFINNLHSEISDKIKEFTHSNEESSVMIDTSDLIYEIDNSFKNQLSSSSEKVAVNDGKTIRKGKPQEVREPKKDKGDIYTPPTKIKERKPKKVKPGDKEKEFKASFTIKSDETERLILGTKDIIRIDLSNLNLSEDYEKGNLKFLVVDGMGKDYANEINLNNVYENALDTSLNKTYELKNDSVQDIEIRNKVLNLEFPIRNSRVKNLKFSYVLEVE